MRIRLLGLLASACLILPVAARAEPAPVAAAIFRPVVLRVDAVLIAANLTDIDPAVLEGTYRYAYDALDGTPAPAAVSLEPAGTASIASEVHDSPGLSAPDSEAKANASDIAASSASEQCARPDAVMGSRSDSSMPGPEVGPASGPDGTFSVEVERSGVTEARSDSLPTTEVTGSLSVTGVPHALSMSDRIWPVEKSEGAYKDGR
jgi:hypothetical protein